MATKKRTIEGEMPIGWELNAEKLKMLEDAVKSIVLEAVAENGKYILRKDDIDVTIGIQLNTDIKIHNLREIGREAE